MNTGQVFPHCSNEKGFHEYRALPRLSTGQESCLMALEQTGIEQPLGKFCFVSFTQYLQSLPKIPSIEQTRKWVLSCAEFLEYEAEQGENFIGERTMSSFECYDGEPRRETGSPTTQPQQDDTQSKPPQNMPYGAIHSRTDLLADFRSQSQSVVHSQKIYHRRGTTEEEMPLLMASPRQSVNSNELPCSSTMSTGSSSSMLNSEHCSNIQEEFSCCWNTCYHKESSVDKVFHHILHAHLHRTTDFRASRCLWRGCSRDGILKVFSSRHQLLIHVGIHCQKLKEPNLSLLGLPRRLFRFRRSQQPH